jgi:hypothetical protein
LFSLQAFLPARSIIPQTYTKSQDFLKNSGVKSAFFERAEIVEFLNDINRKEIPPQARNDISFSNRAVIVGLIFLVPRPLLTHPPRVRNFPNHGVLL